MGLDRPHLCLELHPTAQSVYFCSQYINLTRLSETTNLSVCYLSLIFRGHREPSLKSARNIAKHLGMDLNSFDRQLAKHRLKYKSFLDSQVEDTPGIPTVPVPPL